ncbi:immunoglobulin-like domain-containing protein, partial [Actinomyces succiniciruminis]
MALPVPAAVAANGVPAPTAHYDMSHSGSVLIDVSGNGRDARLTGLDDSDFKVYASDESLVFDGNGYATMPAGAVTGTDNEFTVEMSLTNAAVANQFGWVIGDGIGSWNTNQLGNHVFVNPASGEREGGILSGIRVKTDGGNGEDRVPAGGRLASDAVSTITLVSSGDTITLYVDGVQESQLQHGKSMSDIVKGDVLGYIGRSLYEPDALLKATVTDMKLWDDALTPTEVAASVPTAAERAAVFQAIVAEQIELRLLAANTSLEDVRENLTPPTAVSGTVLTWASSDPAVVAADGTIARGAQDHQSTLTATDPAGRTYVFEVTVKAISDDEVASHLAAELEAIKLESVTYENLPLVAEGARYGSQITWTSSDPSVISETDSAYAAPDVGSADPFEGAGIVSRPAYGSGDKQVVLTATATLGGQSATRTFDVTVAELGRSAPDVGYAAAYFKSDSNERIYQDYTTTNDFFTFTPANGGQPTVASQTDTQGLRDPYILRSVNGDKYYMLATDLCIGCGTSWGDAQSKGSLKIEAWESADLVNWTRTNADDGDTGIVVNQPEAGMTWAPEVYWDDALQSYVVFFASRLYDDVDHMTTSTGAHARMFYVLTRDFETFTYPPQVWQDTGYARIDSTVTKIGDYYYRFTKNEDGGSADGLERGKDIFLERSRVLTSVTTQSSAGTDPATGWQLVDTAMTTPLTGQEGEGPEIVKLNEGDPNNTGDGYVFLVDNYGNGGYVPFV